MPIKYRALLRPEPGVEGGGERKYYASLVLGDEVTVDLLVKQIEKFCTLTRPDIVAVIAALASVVEYELCQSRLVRFDRLGTLYPRIHSTGVLLEEDVNDSLIVSRGIRYRPGQSLMNALANAELKKIKLLEL